MGEYVLEMRDLHTSFYTGRGVIRAVNGVDIRVPAGKIVGIVGESGCGKSITAKSIMGLVPSPGRIDGGSILLNGKELVGLKDKELRAICGKDVSMIFQEPMTSLNPVFKIGRQVREVLLVHGLAKDREDAKRQVIRMFDRVGIPEAEQRYDAYPHELSGGLRQRVMIAMAMVCHPSLLIADEPTTALDVTVEAQILELMKQLCREDGMSVLIITHNMGVVAQLCDIVYVMYAGRIVESAPVQELFDHTEHPYTKGLLASIPRLDENPEYLSTIPGVVPNLLNQADGCVFAPRCSMADDRCLHTEPDPVSVREGHMCRCLASARQEARQPVLFASTQITRG